MFSFTKMLFKYSEVAQEMHYSDTQLLTSVFTSACFWKLPLEKTTKAKDTKTCICSSPEFSIGPLYHVWRGEDNFVYLLLIQIIKVKTLFLNKIRMCLGFLFLF